MESTITLAELIDRNVEMAVTDAVAIAQQLMCQGDIDTRAGAPYGPPTLESIAVTADGTVQCLHTAATPSVMEVALLLQTLIKRSGEHVPGGLRYAIGRALLEVEAPPFDSASDFSAALSRFESGDRRQRIAAVYARAGGAVGDGPAPEGSTRSQVERREHQPSAAELRRQLRETDLKLYEAQRAAGPDNHIVRRRRARKAPIAACMMAGVALVAAGEFAYVERNPEATPRRAEAETPAVTAPASVQVDESLQSAFVGPTLEASPLRQTSSAAGAQSTGQRANLRRKAPLTSRTSTSVTSVGASGRRAAKPSSARPDASKAAPTPGPRQKDGSDHGLLRIRFVWNNPFH